MTPEKELVKLKKQYAKMLLSGGKTLKSIGESLTNTVVRDLLV